MKLQSRFLLLIFTSILQMVHAESNFCRESLFKGSDEYSDTAKASHWIRIQSFNLELIPPSTGIQFYRDGIVFLSSSKFRENMISSHVSFGRTETRYAVLRDSVLEKIEDFSSDAPFPFPSDAVTFSGDFKTMFFTKYSDKFHTEKIYKAVFSPDAGRNGTWLPDQDPINICSDDFIYTHPALSSDSKVMVFSSNRTGSLGGMDLFVTLFKDGKWSDPVNLGDAVNSSFNEIDPYLDSENNLYFSSDNIQGFGGYDIYVCKFLSNTWEKPINLSSPINTIDDDVAFKVRKSDGKSAFYTVKKNEGKRSQQLFMISRSKDNPDTMLTLSEFLTRPDITQMVILALEPAVQATDEENDLLKQSSSGVHSPNDIITYRVQFLNSFNPKTRSQVSVNGENYKVYEYLYSGAYRLCAGEFSSIGPAIKLRDLMRQNDFPNATVVVFRNNTISFEPELLKESYKNETTEAGPGEKASKQTDDKIIDENAGRKVPEAGQPEVKPAQNSKTTADVTLTKKNDTSKPLISNQENKKAEPVYRVQILTNTISKGSTKITIAGRTYDSFEYSYSGAFRTCVGEFKTLSEALVLQKTCRQSGYSQAFVVAFINNERSSDPALFK